MSIPFSILYLAHIGEGQSAANAFEKSKAIAAEAEKQGYQRVWLAEHHGMRGVASAATAVLLAAVGQATSKIRIGSGGIMLPNHSPLVIAEQFGTLATLFPGRVDLGLGRAPGTDMATARALRRNMNASVEDYPADVMALQEYLSDDKGDNRVLAIPGAGTKVPLWLLGSSLYSAKLAGQLGLPYSFASHFAPDMLLDAISVYRDSFRPSAQLDKPYVSAGVMSVVADDEAEAARLFTSVQQQFANLRRQANDPMPAPVDNIDAVLSEYEVAAINNTLRFAIVGTPAQAERQISQFIEATGVDEMIFSFPITDKEKCLGAIRHVGGMTSVMQKQNWAA